MRFILLIIPIICMLGACQTAEQHAKSVSAGQEVSGSRLTVAKVQAEIKKGMSGAGVVSVLGSPNMISTDDQGREVWVYDKISTMSVASSDAGGFSLLLLGVNSSSGATSTSQRTLTIIIKFNKNKKVRDYAYNYSNF